MAVEAVRIGTVIAQDRKALNRWQALRRRTQASVGQSVGLTGAALERVVLGLAVSHPDLVAVRT